MSLDFHNDNVRRTCLRLLLRPLVRYCVKRAHSFRSFVNEAREVFVEVAKEELERSGSKVNASKISAITGLNRRDVKHLALGERSDEESRGIIYRVLGHWEQDPRYCTKQGQPRVLSEEEFKSLVSSVSRHLRAGTVLFELERLGIAEKSTRGIKRQRSLPGTVSDPVEGFELLSQDLDTLISAATENISRGDEIVSNLHIRTEYDNIFVKDIEKARWWLIKEGKAFHRRARNYFSKLDKDINASERTVGEPGGGRVVLGAFGIAQATEPSD